VKSVPYVVWAGLPLATIAELVPQPLEVKLIVKKKSNVCGSD